VIKVNCLLCIYFYTDLHSFNNKVNHSAHSSTGTNRTTSFNSKYLFNKKVYKGKYSLDSNEAFKKDTKRIINNFLKWEYHLNVTITRPDIFIKTFNKEYITAKTSKKKRHEISKIEKLN
jgi:hypothetical protein